MSQTNDYRNPVLPGFYPDPSICRVGPDYFLATSTFVYAPGVPIFRSQNLTDWTQIGNVLDRTSQLDLSNTANSISDGIFAPTLRYHDGKFWMITTIATDAGSSSFLVTASDAAGPWSDPVPIDIEGLDPDIAWDDEGACWVHYSTTADIDRVRIDHATGRVLEGPVTAWSGTGLQFPEAPHLFRRGDLWYLMIAEGGTESGHAVSIARGPSPTGPWESCPANPILSHRSTSRPIQNTGHADLVEAADGSWWMVLLGVRRAGGSPGFHVLGRETFLVPVDWSDGWPVVADLTPQMNCRPPGPTLASTAEAVRDDFDGAELHPRWVGVRRRPQEQSSLSVRPGSLTLAGSGQTLDDPFPTLVARRQQHARCRARATLEPIASGEAGIVLYMDELHHYEIGVTNGSVVASARIGPLQSIVGQAPCPADRVVLVIETQPGWAGGDRVRLAIEDESGNVNTLAELDGRYVSTEVVTGFTGRTIGMYAIDCDASFDWFDYDSVR